MAGRVLVKAELLGGKELQEKLRQLGYAGKLVAARITNKHALDMSNRIKENAIVDRGRLRSSVQIRRYGRTLDSNVLGSNRRWAEGEDGATADVIVATEYAAFIEYGTGPAGRATASRGGPLPEGYSHGNGGKMPPLDLIEEWVKRKGITGRNGESARSIAYLIARKIARNGLPARPFVWPAYQATLGPWQADMMRILSDIDAQSGPASKPGKAG
jgi:hypothetical protein